MQNLSHEIEFDLHENEAVGGTHFHMNSFALRLVLIQRQKQLGNGLLLEALRNGPLPRDSKTSRFGTLN